MNERPMTHEQALDLAAGYVLGALEPAEEAAVREHLLTCSESHDEFAALGGVVPHLADGFDLELVEPPASLGERIMAAAAAELATRSAEGRQPAHPGGSPVAFPSAAEREARARRRAPPLGWAMRIAAVVALVVLAGWNVVLQGQLDATRAYDRAVAAVITAAGEPGSKTVVLTPTEKSQARGLAAVRPDGSVVLAMRDLQATTGTEVYETWVIVGEEAAPIPVGSFTVAPNGLASFTTQPTQAPPGAIIALSLEPQPGSTEPLGPIVSTGVAVAPEN
jgi:anti-sigma factor RsiW